VNTLAGFPSLPELSSDFNFRFPVDLFDDAGMSSSLFTLRRPTREGILFAESSATPVDLVTGSNSTSSRTNLRLLLSGLANRGALVGGGLCRREGFGGVHISAST